MLTPATLSLSPGGLIQSGEAFRIQSEISGELQICQGLSGDFTPIQSHSLTAGVALDWVPDACGQYLLKFTASGVSDVIYRSCSVVDSTWSVCQITIGSFTAEDFAELIHNVHVPADYYINLQRPEKAEAFSANDLRWREYEHVHGDVIHPHVMASDLGTLYPELAHDDPNWETLSQAEIEKRLRALQAWWSQQGYAPLDRIATYTPCNPLIQACKATGIRVIHSLCAEQNWSDGEWAINHWGMPTAPYWIAEDDFRKAGARTETGVMGIIMNHYQVLLPHLTHWGDFVLSPSHFTRWIRAADSGDESTRFKQFLQDTVSGGTPLGEAPFFFVTGFEFGRTFGTANMTAYNRAGLSHLLSLAKTEKMVFATSTDVRAYYDRHVPNLPDRLFRQRDSWFGVTVNGKPGQAGDSVVLECSKYKALIREGVSLPYFYYDYTIPWSFATADTKAPDDFASDCAQALSIQDKSGDAWTVTAELPLSRPIPLAFWDAEVAEVNAFRRLPVQGLDDNRTLTVLEVPKGWQGSVSIQLDSAFAEMKSRHDGLWKLQSFGQGANRHTYLHLDAPLAKALAFPVQLSKSTCVDSAKGTLGTLDAGEHFLEFGPLQGWYRFWGCSVNDLLPSASTQSMIEASDALVGADVDRQTAAHFEALDSMAWSHPVMKGKTKALTVHCGAKLALGTRSRAAAHDEIISNVAGLNASEFADGVMASGPGQSFWYHPRGLHFRIYGLGDAMQAGESWTLLLNSFDPQELDACYRVSVGRSHRSVGEWTLPKCPKDPLAFFPIKFTAADLDDRGRLTISVASKQKALVHWWKEGGFIAAVHAFWLGK